MGTVSFTLDIDTPYGRLTVPSTNFISAHFNSTDGWADIRTQDIQLRVQYKPAGSDLKASTDAGPLNVDLTKVVSVETLYAQAPNAPPAASNPYDQGSAPSSPPSDVYSQPATVLNTSPYLYGAPAPYYGPSYYSPEPYYYSYNYPYEYPYFWWPGFGFTVIGDFDRDHHGHHDRFDGRFHGRDSGVAWNGSRAGGWTAASARQFNRTAGLIPATSGRHFGSTSFRSSAAPTFRSGGTTIFRSASSPSFRGEGMQVSRGGGFSFGGGFGHGGGRRR
jgi:hypothetical protein